MKSHNNKALYKNQSNRFKEFFRYKLSDTKMRNDSLE